MEPSTDPNLIMLYTPRSLVPEIEKEVTCLTEHLILAGRKPITRINVLENPQLYRELTKDGYYCGKKTPIFYNKETDQWLCWLTHCDALKDWAKINPPLPPKKKSWF